jgi:type IV secretion system protein VirB6
MTPNPDFIFFTLIYGWVTSHINSFATDLMGRVTAWVSGLALVIVTIWILMTGYRVITGQMREPLIAVVTQMARIVVILTVATSASIFGTNINTFFTTDLSNEINYVVTGSNGSVYQQIDTNLALTEVAMSAIESVPLPVNDSDTANEKSRASFMATFGTAGPPMTAGVMLLMYQFAMAMFVGFAPLFIMCLIFEQTKELFRKWLLYGIGTLFSLAMLNVVTAMVLELSTGVAGALWTIAAISAFTPGTTEGLSHQAMEQGGIGLLLTMLIVSVPPMTAQFFQGTLGNFLTYTAVSGGMSRSTPGPNGSPPGSQPQLTNASAGPAQLQGGSPPLRYAQLPSSTQGDITKMQQNSTSSTG